ncbi:MAG TPA: hypothetical protein VFT91_06810 [Dehalococcoidia bacterium]|nr:hypothetical protein [Dehalococcoidia bacterium]
MAPVMPMRVTDFMSLVLERTRALVPDDLREFKAGIRFVWLQVHYHTPKVHYEVWLTRKTGRVEIGLHFEGPREFSYRWAELMASHMPEIQARLGPHVELEEWTSAWTRVHQTVAYTPLSEEMAEDVAQRLAQTIAVLQPIVERERANVPVELEFAEPARPLGSRRFQARRRRHVP